MAIRKLLLDTPVFLSLEQFLNAETVPIGVFSVYINGVPIDFDYEDRGFETTTVFFHAALGLKILELPVFLGRKFSESVATNRLFVSDPTLNSHGELTLAWYAGSELQPHLQESLARIFSKITDRKRTIYFGASGGGFAALAFSSLHPHSVAIPVNPQTNIASYDTKFVCRWTRLAWGIDNDEASQELTMPPVVTDLRQVYAGILSNSVIYVQNTGDRSHMQKHWLPFSDYIHPGNSLLRQMSYWGDGHVSPPAIYLSTLLERVATSNSIDSLDLSDLSD